MSFSSFSKMRLFSFLLLLFVILGAFVIDGVFQRHTNHAAHAISPLTVYVGSDDGNVYALDSSTGAIHWRYNTQSGQDYGPQGKPTVVNGTVYVSSGGS